MNVERTMRALGGSMLVLSLLASTASARIKGELLCGVFKNNKVDYTVPAEDGRTIDRNIDCALHVTGARGSVDVNLYTFRPGLGERSMGPQHGGAAGKGKDFEIELVVGPRLDGKIDFTPCSNFEIKASIAGEQAPVWEDRIQVTQACATGAAAPSANGPTTLPTTTQAPAKPSRPAVAARWADSELATFPDAESRALAQRIADAIVSGDGEALAALVGDKGIRAPGKAYPRERIRTAGLAPTGFVPQCCDDDGKLLTKCEWQEFVVNVSSKTELSVANKTTCVGRDGTYLVLKKKGGVWAFTEVRAFEAN